MGEDRFGPAGELGKETPDEQHDPHMIREREARETLRQVRAAQGDLGERVRLAMRRTAALWAQATPTTEAVGSAARSVEAATETHARALARRWALIDFLVDPDLADTMVVTALDERALWCVNLIERGEARSLAAVAEPYRGMRPSALGPILPVWDYAYPAVPQISSGERRERLPDSDVLAVCETCHGGGHQSCASCEGKGFLPCVKCHGRARIPCRRCRGRGIIADEAAERRARAGKGYWQVQAERLANDTAGRLADFAERLRQEHGVPLPPSAQWAPLAPASGVTRPCPDCMDGYVPCVCHNGKVVCAECLGTGQAECKTCAATGRVVRHRELVRRFDTRIARRVVPPEEPEIANWLDQHSLRRLTGETVWEGAAAAVATSMAPAGVPAAVWVAVQAIATDLASPFTDQNTDQNMAEHGERRVLSRQLQLLRVPFTQVTYSFAGHPFLFVAVGSQGSERFWAQTFPTRWTRMSRFFKAVMRDLAIDSEPGNPRPERPEGEISTLAEYRERRMRQQPYRIPILSEEYVVPGPPERPAAPEPAE